jgi:hypothetical protein
MMFEQYLLVFLALLGVKTGVPLSMLTLIQMVHLGDLCFCFFCCLTFLGVIKFAVMLLVRALKFFHELTDLIYFQLCVFTH